MNIAVLTSSRADFGIYLPLLKALKEDSYFNLSIIAFGTHLSPFHGHTIDQIISNGFDVTYRVESMLAGDSANAVATAMSLTALKFADFWNNHKDEFDYVLCLGDRYEMFAAVTAGIPYNIKFAHLHGGERTLGAIDNIFRHAITLASSLHFVATGEYADRVKELIEGEDKMEVKGEVESESEVKVESEGKTTVDSPKVVVVGALSLDNLKNIPMLSKEDFLNKFNIDLNKPTILVTFHSETVNSGSNKKYAEILSETFTYLADKYQIVITLPNADTEGSQIRNAFLELPKSTNNKVICLENFGTQGYFTCIKFCSFLLGNTSSGIIEAASFGKRVINIGDRQKGRACGSNVAHIPIDKNAILEAVKMIEHQSPFTGQNPYDQGGAVDKIISTLKRIHELR